MQSFVKSMLKLFKRAVFGSKKSPLNAPLARALPAHDANNDDVPRYPPFVKGLPVSSTDEVLVTQAELIERIRMALGLNIAEFEALLLPVLRNYAAFVHLLPASEAHHHRGQGGLLRHGLEAAFGAAQASDGVIFSIQGTPKEKRDTEPRWRLASTLAGLLHDAGKPFSDVTVSDGKGRAWDPNSDSLVDWALSNNIDRYFLRWRDNRHKRHEAFSLLTLDKMIPTETRKYISDSNTRPEIMGALLEAFSGVRTDGPVTKLMIFADRDSVQRDLKTNKLNVDEFAYGVPVERYVFDAIRRLVSSGKWKVNEPGAKVWRLHQGVFIAWRSLGDMYDLISKDKIPGIPKDPDTLADILIERDFAIENKVKEGDQEATYRYWEVQPEGIPTKIFMLRFNSHELIFTSEPPPPVSGVITGEVDESSVGTSSASVVESDDQPTESDEDVQGDAETSGEDQQSSDDVLKATEAISSEVDDLFGDVGVSGVLGMLQSSSDADEEKSGTGTGDAELQDASGEDAKPEQGSAQVAQDEKPEKPVSNAQSPARSAKSTGNKVSHVKLFQEATEAINEGGTEAAATTDKATTDKASKTKAKTSKAPKNSPLEEVSATPRDTLCAVLSKHSIAGPLLEKLLLPSVDNPEKLGQTVRIIRGQAVIPFPAGVKELGDRSKVIKALDDDGALQTDPVMPGKRVQEVGGVKCLILDSVIGDAFKRAIAYDASLNVSEKGNSKPTKARPYTEALTKKVKSSLKTLTAATKEKANAGATEQQAPTQNKTVSQPLKRPIQAASEEQSKPASRIIEDEKLEIFKGEETVMQLQDDSEFISDKNQVTKIVEKLKQMVIAREGRWLASPVTTNPEGALCTSGLAIDHIVLEHPALTKALIRRELFSVGFSSAGKQLVLPSSKTSIGTK